MLQSQVFIGDTGSRLTDEQLKTELIYATLAYMGVFGTDSLDS